MDKQVLKALFDDMTLKEKIGQLNQVIGGFYEDDSILTGPMKNLKLDEDSLKLTGSVINTIGAQRIKQIQETYMEQHPHHIPLLFMGDIINGYRTIFPIPLAQGCTFEPELSKKAASVAARESAASGLHLTFSPMVDLVRDARWGRVMESTGEDTYLNSLFSRAIVEGYQGSNLKEKGCIAACVKHFAAYGAPTGGRDYNNVELSKSTLREDYLPAYKAAIESDVAMVMSSFNTVDRVPVTASKKMLREILRTEMGFDGVVISDWSAIEELIHHGVATNGKEAAQLALKAGVDIDMMTGLYMNYAEALVEEGVVEIDIINEAAWRILELKNKLGLFENPYKDLCIEDEENLILCDEYRKLAREIAVKSCVLLKNDGLLPIENGEKTIALIGPYGNDKNLHGAWSNFAAVEEIVSLKEAMCKMIKHLEYAKGCEILDRGTVLEGFTEEFSNFIEEETARRDLIEAVNLAKKSKMVILAIGEHRCQTGEAACRSEITIPKIQMDLFEKIYEVNQNIVVVLFNGRPLDIRELSTKAKAILIAWFPGTEGGSAIADILFGKENPSGRLTMSFPRNVGQIPIFYNEFSTGRPYLNENKDKFRSKYLDTPNTPLYPFGYGLSYTQFQYSSVKADKNFLQMDESLSVQVTVKNIGAYKGREVVQLYIRDLVGSVARPVRSLKAHQSVYLEPGEAADITFVIDEEMLKYYTLDQGYKAEPGEFEVYIGGDSTTENSFLFKLLD